MTTILISPTQSFTYDGARFNVYHANKNESLPKHEHVFDHATVTDLQVKGS